MTQIVALEGLFGYGFFNDIQNGLLSKLGPSDPNLGIWRGSWSKMSTAPLDFEADKLIVIGHSMGGPMTLHYCERLKKRGRDVNLLLTLDPRGFAWDYLKPTNAKKALNFHRGRFGVFDMQGYEVLGAENFKLNCGHRAVPYQPEVLKVLLNELRG